MTPQHVVLSHVALLYPYTPFFPCAILQFDVNSQHNTSQMIYHRGGKPERALHC